MPANTTPPDRPGKGTLLADQARRVIRGRRLAVVETSGGDLMLIARLDGARDQDAIRELLDGDRCPMVLP